MSFGVTLTAVRSTPVHWPTVLNQLRTSDATIGLAPQFGSLSAYLDKDTPWTSTQISDAQTVLNTAMAETPQIVAQFAVDRFSIEYRALILALVDQINVIRAALPTPMAAITPAQAMNAIRNKAATLQ